MPPVLQYQPYGSMADRTSNASCKQSENFLAQHGTFEGLRIPKEAVWARYREGVRSLREGSQFSDVDTAYGKFAKVVNDDSESGKTGSDMIDAIDGTRYAVEHMGGDASEYTEILQKGWSRVRPGAQLGYAKARIREIATHLHNIKQWAEEEQSNAHSEPCFSAFLEAALTYADTARSVFLDGAGPLLIAGSEVEFCDKEALASRLKTRLGGDWSYLENMQEVKVADS